MAWFLMNLQAWGFQSKFQTSPKLLFGHSLTLEVVLGVGQNETGIRGYPPGEATELYLRGRLKVAKFWGGLAIASIAVSANLFDKGCKAIVGTSFGSLSLLLIVSLALSAIRQVSS